MEAESTERPVELRQRDCERVFTDRGGDRAKTALESVTIVT